MIEPDRVDAIVKHPAFLLSVGLLGGLVLHQVWLSSQRKQIHKLMQRPSTVVYAPHFTQNQAAPVEAPKAAKKNGRNTAGVAVEMGRLRVKDWNAWMKYSPRMMTFALNAGAQTSGDVLRVVLGAALPQYAWPPEEGSGLRGQWDHLSGVVAETLGLPDLPPTPRREDKKPHLRLIK